MASVSASAGICAMMAVNALVSRQSKELHHADHRVDARYPFNQPVTIGKLRGSDFAPLFAAYATDISNTGLGILTRCELTPGKEYVIDLTEVMGDTCRVAFRAVHCSQILPEVYRSGGIFAFEE